MSAQEASMAMRAFQQQIMQKRMQGMGTTNGQNPSQMPPQMMIPSPEQQKSMMLMGINQMKARFS